jgi:hypothetical protein
MEEDAMAELTPFAQMPTTPDPLVAQLRQQLAAAYPEAARRDTSTLDAIATQAIRGLWGSRIKTFVPILALREAQTLAHERGWDVAGQAMPPLSPPARTLTSAPPAVRTGSLLRDRLSVVGDTLDCQQAIRCPSPSLRALERRGY